MERTATSLPIEFDLLDYEPEPWSPAGSLAIQVEFQWYLTGRFPVIVIPELAKRRLPGSALYRAFLQGESDEESILHTGDYSPRPRQSATNTAVGPAGGDPCEGEGSNNWAIAGSEDPKRQAVAGQAILTLPLPPSPAGMGCTCAAPPSVRPAPDTREFRR